MRFTAAQALFQYACADFMRTMRSGDKEGAKKFLDLSNAIEDAYPDEIQEYRDKTTAPYPPTDANEERET